jgi:hypothetical protein
LPTSEQDEGKHDTRYVFHQLTRVRID